MRTPVLQRRIEVRETTEGRLTVTVLDRIVELGVAGLVAFFWVAVFVGIAFGVSVLTHRGTGGPRHA
jgi:hypothetical protein